MKIILIILGAIVIIVFAVIIYRGGLTSIKNLLLSVWGIITVIFFILGLFLTYNAFTPKLSIYADESLNDDFPFATPFVIQNKSLLSVYSIKKQCLIKYVAGVHGGSATGFITEWTDTNVPNL